MQFICVLCSGPHSQGVLLAELCSYQEALGKDRSTWLCNASPVGFYKNHLQVSHETKVCGAGGGGMVVQKVKQSCELFL